MGRVRVFVLPAIVFGIVQGAGGQSRSASSMTPRVTVRAWNAGGLVPWSLHSARNTAGSIMSSAGIALAWYTCGTADHLVPFRLTRPSSHSACFEQPAMAEFSVRLSPARGKASAGEELGYAWIDTAAGAGTMATVFTDRVESLAQAARVDPGTLLGRTVAHELGHLLLGTTRHAEEGLMRARWTVDELRARSDGDWRFTASEGQVMRAKLAGGVTR